MSRWATNLFIIFILSSAAYNIILKKDSWPFSGYAMYSHVQEKTDSLEQFVFQVVDENNITSKLRRRDIAPYDILYLQRRMYFLYEDVENKREEMRSLLRTTIKYYNAQREKNFRGLPKLKKLRVLRIENNEEKLIAEVLNDL